MAFHPLDISPALILSIGQVAVQWARVEWTLQKMVVGIMNADGPVGLLVTSNLGFRSMQEFICTFIEAEPVQGEEFCADLSILIAEAQRLLGIRNAIVHNIWPPEKTESSTDYAALVVRFKGKVQLRTDIWSQSQLDTTIQEIIDLLVALSEFGLKHDLFAPIDTWEKHSTSLGTFAPRGPARPQSRSPKTEAVVSRLLSSPE